MATIHCLECGRRLAKGASFCGACGARLPAPDTSGGTAPPVERSTATRGADSSHNRGAIAAALAVLAIGAGAAVAILLAARGGSPSTTVVRSTTVAGRDGGAMRAGRYVQSGSFQTASHAEAEQRRLAARGIEVEVVSSDDAEELYPGFEVLLAGPFGARAAEAATLKRLHRNGVPSAFSRDLTPASDGIGSGAAAGSWSGSLERTSSEHPNLNGSLAVTLSVAPSGTSGSLALRPLRCDVSLSLLSAGNHTISYGVEPPCAGTGPLIVRPLGDELMLTVRSPSTDSFALGTLSRD